MKNMTVESASPSDALLQQHRIHILTSHILISSRRSAQKQLSAESARKCRYLKRRPDTHAHPGTQHIEEERVQHLQKSLWTPVGSLPCDCLSSSNHTDLLSVTVTYLAVTCTELFHVKIIQLPFFLSDSFHSA